MSIKVKSYKYPDDFNSVGQFLVETYLQNGKHRNWLQPRWEYMHFHPILDESSLNKIGIWKDNGKVVGVVHHEHQMGEVYFEIDQAYLFLRKEMLEYAEANLCKEEKGRKYLLVFIDETDDDFIAAAENLGFQKNEKYKEPMSQLKITDPFPPINVPEGFLLKSMQDENDLEKRARVLHRGFNHPGEPPEDGIEGTRKMQSAPNFKKDLTIVAVAPNGDFVSFCGMWYEPVNKIAYVEPVATDPNYRRKGLGKAAVLEGIRRCGELGATIAYVGTGKAFYKSMGFYEIYTQCTWKKEEK